MLKVNVGISRKVSRDYNSTGFSINLEGEIGIPLDHPERVLEKIQEFYDLAEESLRHQVDRHEGDSAIASRDQEPPSPRNTNSSTVRVRTPETRREATSTPTTKAETASTKQINYLLEIGRRRRLTTTQLEAEVAQILGRSVGLYELAKGEAGAVIDALKSGSKA